MDINWQGQKGMSSDCTLNPMVIMALLMSATEHPCDRCNMDRKKCRGFPRKRTEENILRPIRDGE